MLTAMGALPPNQRTVLLRHEVEGETVQEIADALGKTPGAIEQMLWRARQSLRKLLEKRGTSEADLREYFAPP